MKLWSAFLRDVRPGAPTVPEPVLEHAIRRAAQKFCQETRAWQIELDPTLTIDGYTSYDLELPTNTELVRLERAALNGQDFAIWRAGDSSRGRFVCTPDGKTLTLSQALGAGSSLVLTISAKPGEKATGVDDALYDRYVTEISLGAVASLTGDLNKRAEFDNAIASIKTALWRGSAAIRPRARASYF